MKKITFLHVFLLLVLFNASAFIVNAMNITVRDGNSIDVTYEGIQITTSSIVYDFSSFKRFKDITVKRSDMPGEGPGFLMDTSYMYWTDGLVFRRLSYDDNSKILVFGILGKPVKCGDGWCQAMENTECPVDCARPGHSYLCKHATFYQDGYIGTLPVCNELWKDVTEPLAIPGRAIKMYPDSALVTDTSSSPGISFSFLAEADTEIWMKLRRHNINVGPYFDNKMGSLPDRKDFFYNVIESERADAILVVTSKEIYVDILENNVLRLEDLGVKSYKAFAVNQPDFLKMSRFCPGCEYNDECISVGLFIEDNTLCRSDFNVGPKKKSSESCNFNEECESNICLEKKCISPCEGCLLQNGKCYAIGERLNDLYCSADKKFKKIKEPEESCDSNFECISNYCISKKCSPVCDGCIDERFECHSYGSRKGDSFCSSENAFEKQLEKGKTCTQSYECETGFCHKSKCKTNNFFTRLWVKLFG